MGKELSSPPENESKMEIHHQETTTCSNVGMVTFIVGLVSGTFSALICKMSYDTSSVGLNGDTKLFAKPIMMLLLMFSAMVPSIFFWLIQQSMLKKEDRDVVSYKTMAVLIIPSVCDLLCTTLLLVAQLYITASLWQMMRGSVIIITALLKRFALNHRLKLHMWIGVSIITLAMLLVASTSLFGHDSAEVINTGKDPRIGVMLVFIGCLAQGIQYVFEEKVMAVDNAPPLVVIGCEGIWGTLLTVLVVYPLAYLLPGDDNGHFEDFFDATHMIAHSPSLQMLTVSFVVTVTVYNCMVVYVTKYLSAIWHAILDNFRPISIWGLDLAIFYLIFPGTGLGEQWVSASWLQLAGLVILLFGTAFYNGSIKTFQDAQYESLEEECSEADTGYELTSGAANAKTPPLMVSPSLMRSPLVYNNANAAEPGAVNRRSQKERTSSADNIQLRSGHQFQKVNNSQV